MATTYEVKSREDIITIPDVKTCHTLARTWGLSVKGLKTKNDIIKVLLDDWDEKHSPVTTNVHTIEDVIEANRERTNLLLQKYDEMKSFYEKLNDVLREDINSVFQNFTDELESRKQQVMTQDCVVLVVGDKVSGKSSFINLLLSKDILPTKQLACTATICELKHSNKGETNFAILYTKDDTTRIDLNEDEKQQFKTLKSHIQELIEDESPFLKIEIFWPFEILKNGIILVDTPGISENRMIIQKLKEYMKQSFGFIYIIDSAQATGLQKGRLSDFLRLVVNASDDMFDPRATIFVCNKWDVVPVTDQPGIKSITLQKLVKVFPGLMNNQVFTFSTLERKFEELKYYAFPPYFWFPANSILYVATRSAAFNSTHPEFEKMFERGFKKLIPAAIQNKLLHNYRWLKQVLQRVCYSLKMTQIIGAQQIQADSEKVEKLKEQISVLQSDAKDVVESAREFVEMQTDNLHKKIADFLRSRDARDKICTWKSKSCPQQADYKKVYKEATEMVADRIMQVVDAWETKHQFVQGLQESVLHKFEEECKLMDNQLEEVEGILRVNYKSRHNDIKSVASAMMLFFPSGNKVGGVDGIGSAVSCAGNLSLSDKKVKELFKKYKLDINGEGQMMQASVFYIEDIFVGNQLRESLSKFLRRFIKGIDVVAEKIPQFIKADNALIWKLELNLNECTGALKSVYPALARRANTLHGQLDLFYVTKCMKQDYSLESIKWSANDLLGVGSFSNVYKATLKVGLDSVKVAVKITNDHYSVKESTVTDILREEGTLRSLKHQNIVKYHGSVLYETERKVLKWVMILEYCYDTMKNKLVNGSFKNPGCVSRERRLAQIQEMAEYVTQLCSGLQYLHDKNLVHRDLKTENVLLTRENDKDVVKLTDVGLTKSEELISGTYVGTPVYMAPEVICRSGTYDRKADIYSLSVILWELWYGQDASEHIGQILLERNLTLNEAIEKHKLRPSLEIESCPSLEIEDVIAKCWDDLPKKRLDARDVEYFFGTYL